MFTLFWVKEIFYMLNKILTEIFDLEIKGKIVSNIQWARNCLELGNFVRL